MLDFKSVQNLLYLAAYFGDRIVGVLNLKERGTSMSIDTEFRKLVPRSDRELRIRLILGLTGQCGSEN